MRLGGFKDFTLKIISLFEYRLTMWQAINSKFLPAIKCKKFFLIMQKATRFFKCLKIRSNDI